METVGQATFDERYLTSYLLNGLALLAEKKPIERSTLIAAISQLCKLVFTQETPLSIKEQCEEIDAFCEFLKSHSLRNCVKE
jgi:hypothetical protein